jgi:hypothetical protein
MKNTLSIICLLLIVVLKSNLIYAQKKVFFYDTIFNEAIPNIYVFNSMDQFIGATNKKGHLSISKNNFPIRIEKAGYQNQVFKSFSDTCFVSIRIQELASVDVKPVNKLQLYHKWIKNSSKEINRKPHLINGTYFESLVLIDKNANDTIYLDKTCDLAIKGAMNNKQIDYRFYYDNPKSSLRTKIGDESYLKRLIEEDTSVLSNMLNMVPSLSKLLRYNLDQTKPFKLKFEEAQIERKTLDSLHIFDFVKENEKKKSKQKVKAWFLDKKLVLFERPLIWGRVISFAGMKMAMPFTNTYVEYDVENGYGIRNFHVEQVVQMEFDKGKKSSSNSASEKIDLYLVRGFVHSNGSGRIPSKPIKNIDDIFKNLPNSKVPKFYNFINLK